MKDNKNIVSNAIAKQTLWRIVRNAKGDNLERAEAAFCNYTEEDMKKQYGQSNLTCREVLDGYLKERKEWEAALELAESICR